MERRGSQYIHKIGITDCTRGKEFQGGGSRKSRSQWQFGHGVEMKVTVYVKCWDGGTSKSVENEGITVRGQRL